MNDRARALNDGLMALSYEDLQMMVLSSVKKMPQCRQFYTNALPFVASHPQELLADPEARAEALLARIYGTIPRVRPQQMGAARAAGPGPGPPPNAPYVSPSFLPSTFCFMFT